MSFPEINLTSLKNEFDLIIIHYLKSEYYSLLNNVSFDIDRIIWVMWGADAYQLGAFFNTFLMPKTKYFRFKNEFSKGIYKGFFNIFRSIYPKIFDLQKQYKTQISNIKSIRNIITLAPDDAVILSKIYNLNANVFHLNYLDPTLINPKEMVYQMGENILLGNSAEYTNNSYDAIDLLENVNALISGKVILPISYGDKTNAKFIQSYSLKKLKDKATPLLGFIEFEKYNELINTCEISIMPHIRQQALGNIVKLIFNGSHVYFNSLSTVYQFLKKNGFYVSTLEDIKNLKKLNINEKQNNSRLILEFFGKNHIHLKVSKIITSVLKN